MTVRPSAYGIGKSQQRREGNTERGSYSIALVRLKYLDQCHALTEPNQWRYSLLLISDGCQHKPQARSIPDCSF